MKKRYITWLEVMMALDNFDKEGRKVYGVPKGGMIAAGFLRSAISICDPKESDLILDDLIDSGATKEKYGAFYPGKPFAVLFDKKEMGTNDWLVMPWEKDHPGGEDTIEQNIVRQLEYIGEDPNREGLKGTPSRIVRAWEELFAGYWQDPRELITDFAGESYDQMILLRDVEVYSMCEHHMLPFFGKAHVAYIPGKNGRVLGISKLARLVDLYSRRLQIQERVGEQVTSFLMTEAHVGGAACIIEAEHLCMRMRGCNKQNSTMITSSLKGIFLDNSGQGFAARNELMGLIK